MQGFAPFRTSTQNMATIAQRQQAYRLRQVKDEVGLGERLSAVVDSQAKRALKEAPCRLLRLTQRAMLQRLLQNAERALLDRAQAIPTSGPVITRVNCGLMPLPRNALDLHNGGHAGKDCGQQRHLWPDKRFAVKHPKWEPSA